MRELAIALMALVGAAAEAEEAAACRVLCAPEFSVEPTVTISNLLQSPRIAGENGDAVRQRRDAEFEVILSVGIPTRVRWLEFTVEAIFLPFESDSTPELEFETNVTWLPAERTRGWLSSHFDIVDKFSAAERPTDRRAYTHKLNLELDTSLAVFRWMREDRWLRGVELEGSLDYVATGLPKRGDIIEGRRYLDRASPWSFSLVFVLPVAPM
jgi:hypothetical protein